jgi:hypothetical protein
MLSAVATAGTGETVTVAGLSLGVPSLSTAQAA